MSEPVLTVNGVDLINRVIIDKSYCEKRGIPLRYAKTYGVRFRGGHIVLVPESDKSDVSTQENSADVPSEASIKDFLFGGES